MKRRTIPIFYCITLSIFFIGCDKSQFLEKVKAKQQEFQDSIDYENLIMSVALSAPEFHVENLSIARATISNIVKTRCDDSLDVTINLHQWTYGGGQSFPRTIIYFNNHHGFECAFPFLDEYYMYQYKSYDMDRCSQRESSFGYQLDYLYSKLDTSYGTAEIRAEGLLSLICDSVLEMKRVRVDDWQNLIQMETSMYNGNTPCADSLTKILKQVIIEMQNNPISKSRYYTTSTGQMGFWKFEFIKDWDGTHIVPTFLNRDCYYKLII